MRALADAPPFTGKTVVALQFLLLPVTSAVLAILVLVRARRRRSTGASSPWLSEPRGPWD
ncbi:MAG: hypothetical protein R2694_04335 [Ilumatobacteraceae bacterium]